MTVECANDLGALGAALNVSANDAQRLLSGAGTGRKRRVVQHAVAWRREQVRDNPATSIGTTSGTAGNHPPGTPGTTPGDRREPGGPVPCPMPETSWLADTDNPMHGTNEQPLPKGTTV